MVLFLYWLQQKGKKEWLQYERCGEDYDFKEWEDISKDKPVIGVDYEWEMPDGNENNCVIRVKDRWFMLYSASLTKQKIAYATSYDLLHWEKEGICDIPVFRESALRFGAAFVIEGLSKDGSYYMIYMGEDINQRTILDSSSK